MLRYKRKDPHVSTLHKELQAIKKSSEWKNNHPQKRAYQLFLQCQMVSLDNTPKIILHMLRHIDKGRHESQKGLLEGLEEVKLYNSIIISNLSS